MGIKGLMKLISDNAPKALKEEEMKALFGRKVAIDASMSLYQFLIAVRSGQDASMLTNEFGEVTSHLQGLFHRTIRMMENGVKPVYVFDGKPPVLKSGELAKRKEAREKANANLEHAEDNELEQEEINKYNRRLVKVTPEHNAEAKKLLTLMGVPVIDAPGEAEAQCAEMCKAGVVYATATEDMDALTFGSPKLVRNLTFSAARKLPVVEVDLPSVLQTLGLTMNQFIDLCILLGCDYTTNIKGIGPSKALKMIKDHGSIEEALKSLDSEKYKVEDFLYKEAAQLFVKPDVVKCEDLKLDWKDPDEEGLVQFLCKEKGFNEERVKSSIEKLKKAKGTGAQQRLENFFGAATLKRKEAPEPKGGAAKKSKTGAAAKKK